VNVKTFKTDYQLKTTYHKQMKSSKFVEVLLLCRCIELDYKTS